MLKFLKNSDHLYLKHHQQSNTCFIKAVQFQHFCRIRSLHDPFLHLYALGTCQNQIRAQMIKNQILRNS